MPSFEEKCAAMTQEELEEAKRHYTRLMGGSAGGGMVGSFLLGPIAFVSMGAYGYGKTLPA
jgi:hypothetical protein